MRAEGKSKRRRGGKKSYECDDDGGEVPRWAGKAGAWIDGDGEAASCVTLTQDERTANRKESQKQNKHQLPRGSRGESRRETLALPHTASMSMKP